MIKQDIYLHKYDWDVVILYDVRPSNADYVIDILHDMGCSEKHLYHADDLLRSGVPNQGLTYSNSREHLTLIVVGHASDIFQVINTLEHETNHLEMHICEFYGIDPYSEEASYLSGNIKEALARNAWHTMKKLFLYLI